MSIEQETRWITGEEFGREWRRLTEAGLPRDAPEFEALMGRLVSRDEALYERYGKPHLSGHYGKWIAIGVHGEVLIRPTAGEASRAGQDLFGTANYAVRKLAEFPGHQL